MYIFLAFIYALFIGGYNIFKKVSIKKSGAATVLALFTSACFLMSLIWIPMGIAIPSNMIWIFIIKGLIASFNWYFVLRILKNTNLTLVIAMDMLSTVLTFIFGITIFGEVIRIMQIVGSILIVVGVALVNLLNKKETGKINVLHFFLLLLSAMISTACGIIDKYTTTYLTNFQVQFWFLLFACVFSWVYFSIDCFRAKQFLIKKEDLANYWIYFIALCLFLGDFMLFMAYRQPGSQMIIISIISKLKIIVTMFAGIFIFKEKNVAKKIALTLLIILGAIFVSIF